MKTKQLVEALESIEPGAPFGDALAAALEGVAADRAEAAAVVFPSEVPRTSADVFAALRHFTDRWGNSSYRQSLEDLHGRSLSTWPELAAALRSPEFFEDVAGAAMSGVPAVRKEQQAAAKEARALVLEALAAQLADAKGHELAEAAGRYVSACELQRRIDAAREVHAGAAAAALDAAKAAVIETEARRRAEAARVSGEASDEAARLTVEAKRAAQKARQLKAAELSILIEASGRDSIRVGDELFDKQYLLDRLATTDDAMLARVAAALEGQTWV